METSMRRLALLALACSVAAPALAQDSAEKSAPRHKPQSETAGKAALGQVAASSPAVGKALEVSDMAGAKKLVGKAGAFKGTVVKVYSPKSNSIVILNFAEKYQDTPVAVVKPEAYAKFPDLTLLKGKRVLVTGTFTEFKGQPQIELKEPAQLKLVK
jgi:DNA/RNA endonuclease YhcR with UshA esterase domain